MPYEIFLALRHLRMRRGRRIAQATALAAVFGIAFGVAALIVALALANGFRDELRDKILRGTAHLTLMRRDGRPVAEWREVVTQLRAVEGVVDASATTYTGALLSGPEGAAYTVLRGVDAQSERALSEIRRTLVQGGIEPLFHDALPGGEQTGGEAERRKRSDEPEGNGPPARVVVGAELAARTGLVRVGDEGWVITGETTPTQSGFVPRSRRVRVAGIFRSGLYDYDAAWVYASLADASSLSGATGKSSVISIEVADIYGTEAVAGRVQRAVGDLWTTVDWREANRPLFAALELERRTVATIILLIMVVAALNITTTLGLVVVERRADIAILNAMGARARNVMAIFMIEGACIGAAGALLGVAFGLAACALGNHFELVRLPADVYSLSAVPFHPHARDVALPAVAAFVVSLLATVYPARAATRVRPAEVLRYE